MYVKAIVFRFCAIGALIIIAKMNMPGEDHSSAPSTLLFALPIILIAVGGVFHIASLAGDCWIFLAKDAGGTNVLSFGLWRSCHSTIYNSRTSCLRLDAHPEIVRLIGGEDYIVVARALCLISLLSSVATAGLAVISAIASKKNARCASLILSFIAAGTALILQAICLLVALIVYVTVFKENVDLPERLGDFEYLQLGWSFALGCTAVGCYVVGCVVFICGPAMARQRSSLSFRGEEKTDVSGFTTKPVLLVELPKKNLEMCWRPMYCSPSLSAKIVDISVDRPRKVSDDCSTERSGLSLSVTYSIQRSEHVLGHD